MIIMLNCVNLETKPWPVELDQVDKLKYVNRHFKLKNLEGTTFIDILT